MKKLFVLLLLLNGITLADSLRFDIAVTRQDASLDWWYAVPQNFSPHLSNIDDTYQGECLRVFPLFAGYAADTNGYANITFDFEIVKPDGSVMHSLKGCAGHDGLSTLPEPIPGHAVLSICIEPDDPLGNYKINIKAFDHIASATNKQTRTLCVKPVSVESLTANQRDTIFLRYATTPDPVRALHAFLQTEHSFFDEDKEPIWAAIWFYKVIFENNEFLVPHLLNGFTSAPLKQQRDTILLLTLLNKTDKLPRTSGELNQILHVMKAGRAFDPYQEITSGKQVDMLWAEFFATGTVRPIKHLLTALNLAEHSGTIEKIKNGTLDAENSTVTRAAILEAVFQSTLWSLRDNFRKSPLLFQYCVGILNSEELEKPAQSCLAMLLESVAQENEDPKEIKP